MQPNRRAAFEVTSSRTREIALLNLVINGVESIIAEYGCESVGVELPEASGGKLMVYCSSCEEFPEEGFELDQVVEYGLVKEYEFVPGRGGRGLRELYRRVRELIAKEVTSTLAPYALKCALTEVEYMLVILQNGSAALLEGERDRVVIPNIKASLSAHTHPRGCTPSPHDLKSLINLLFEGGLGSAIISTECGLLVVRDGPFTEDDLLALSKLRDSLSGRDIEPLKKALREGRVGPNLMVALIS